VTFGHTIKALWINFPQRLLYMYYTMRCVHYVVIVLQEGIPSMMRITPKLTLSVTYIPND